MPHRRQKIRDYFVAALTGLPTTGASVEVSAVYPVPTGEVPTIPPTLAMPNLRVMTPSDERSDDQSMASLPGRAEVRELTVVVEARAEGPAYYNTLDDIALEVENAIMADPYLGGLALYSQLDDVETEGSGELNEPAGLMVQNWTVTYDVNAVDPQ